MGSAGAPRFSAQAWAASLVVKPGTLFERKSPGDLLHVLSRTTESRGAGPGADQVSDAPRRGCD